jgi:uncharacterized protein involved in exopolysaccharide biosynthesis
MTDTTVPSTGPAPGASDDEMRIVDYLVVLYRGRWLVIAFCFTTVVAAMVYMSVFAPFEYLATASVLPPKETGATGLLGSVLGSAGGEMAGQLGVLSGASAAPNRDQFMGVLKSRTVFRAVVEKFKLRERYQLPILDDAVVQLQKNADISYDREGVITVSVMDTDPYIAAAIANFFVSELDRLVTAYNTTEAGRTRGFMTLQLAKAKAALSEAEEGVRKFQEKNRAIVLHDQTRGAIDAAVRLKAEIIAAEVQLQVMRTWMTDASPDVIAQVRRIDEMKRYLADMQYGDEVYARKRSANGRNGAVATGRDEDFHVPFAKVPEVGLELARLTREAKIQEAVVTLLTQQYEQARLGEARDLPTVRVLDVARPPDKHYKPKFLMWSIIAFAGSLFIGALLPFGVEHVRRLRRAWPSALAASR